MFFLFAVCTLYMIGRCFCIIYYWGGFMFINLLCLIYLYFGTINKMFCWKKFVWHLGFWFVFFTIIGFFFIIYQIVCYVDFMSCWWEIKFFIIVVVLQNYWIYYVLKCYFLLKKGEKCKIYFLKKEKKKHPCLNLKKNRTLKKN